jgi:hypothetical protein
LDIDANTGAISESGLASECASTANTDLTSSAESSTATTVKFIGLEVDTYAQAIGQTFLAGELTSATGADLAGCAFIVAFTAM